VTAVALRSVAVRDDEGLLVVKLRGGMLDGRIRGVRNPRQDMSVTITSAVSGFIWHGRYRRVRNESVDDPNYGRIPVMSIQEGGKVRRSTAVQIVTDLPQGIRDGLERRSPDQKPRPG